MQKHVWCRIQLQALSATGGCAQQQDQLPCVARHAEAIAGHPLDCAKEMRSIPEQEGGGEEQGEQSAEGIEQEPETKTGQGSETGPGEIARAHLVGDIFGEAVSIGDRRHNRHEDDDDEPAPRGAGDEGEGLNLGRTFQGQQQCSAEGHGEGEAQDAVGSVSTVFEDAENVVAGPTATEGVAVVGYGVFVKRAGEESFDRQREQDSDRWGPDVSCGIDRGGRDCANERAHEWEPWDGGPQVAAGLFARSGRAGDGDAGEKANGGEGGGEKWVAWR